MYKKLTLITILLLGNIAYSQEPKLIEKYLFATLKGKIDDRYYITMNIKISGVSYSWTGGISGDLSGNYHYDKYGKNISLTGKINNNMININTWEDGDFNFKLNEETLNKILNLKNYSENITVNGAWEYKSKSFPCVINSVSPLGGKLSEMFEYTLSNDEHDYGKNILYSPSINVSYFGNDIKNIDIKNLKNIYERKLKKVVNNETYTYSDCYSTITYFDNKILCVGDYLTLSDSEIENTYYINHDYNIISLETGKKLNNTLADLVDYNERFKEFFKKEFQEYLENEINFSNSMLDAMKLYSDNLKTGESDDFNFTDYFNSKGDSEEAKPSFDLIESLDDLDFSEELSKSKFIFNDDGTIDIYNDYFTAITKGHCNNLSIEIKELKPYIKKDSFYRYLFD